MTAKEICERIATLLEPIAKENNVEIDDVEFVKEGPNYYLRVYIDKEGGIFISDCENVSRASDLLLDEIDYITVPYILEVSSPGIDKVLKKEKDFIKYKGRDIELKLYKAINKQKEFVGELVGLENNELTVIVDDEEVKFDFATVAQVRLYVEF